MEKWSAARIVCGALSSLVGRVVEAFDPKDAGCRKRPPEWGNREAQFLDEGASVVHQRSFSSRLEMLANSSLLGA